MIAAHDGRLWIGTYKGLASWNDGKLTKYRGLLTDIDVLLEDREARYGRCYAGSIGRLCAIKSGSAECSEMTAGLVCGWRLCLRIARQPLGRSADRAVAMEAWPSETLSYALPFARHLLPNLNESDDGALLIATDGGIKKLVDGKAEAYALPGTALHAFKPLRMHRDRNGGLWIGTTDRGLLHVHQGKDGRFAAA